MNDDKTELIVFASKYKQDVYNDLSTTIGESMVDCRSQFKNKVIFDQVLLLHQRVASSSSSCHQTAVFHCSIHTVSLFR